MRSRLPDPLTTAGFGLTAAVGSVPFGPSLVCYPAFPCRRQEGGLRRRQLFESCAGVGRALHGRGDSQSGSATARKRSIIAFTCSGTSSWQKWPEPTVLPYSIWGNGSWKRVMSERGWSSSAAT